MNRPTIEDALSLLLAKYGRLTITRTTHEVGSDSPRYPAIRDRIECGGLTIVPETVVDGTEDMHLPTHLRWAILTVAEKAQQLQSAP